MLLPPRTRRALVGLASTLWLASLPVALAARAATAADFRISEVLHHNDQLTAPEFLDEDGTRQPFAEIENRTGSPQTLLGWSLARSATDPDPFVLPDVTVPVDGSIVVWLSGKDRAVAGQPLHANFSPVDGRDLYLLDPLSVVADSFVGHPLPIDQSMGRCTETGSDEWYRIRSPSPGIANHYFDVAPFVFLEDQVSLEAGVPVQLHVWPDVPVTWSSSNPRISVSATGLLSADTDYLFPFGRGDVTATLAGGAYSQMIDVTIVNWTTNVSRLELYPESRAEHVLSSDATGTRFSVGTTLFESTSGLADPVAVGTVPFVPVDGSRLHSTPFGHILLIGTNIYRSTDLSNWTLEHVSQVAPLAPMFDTYWDAATQTGYVFVGEYSVDSTHYHRVYRGTYPDVGPPVWETILEFDPLDDWTLDPGALDAVRHIHVVTIDPHTGDLYVGTGDQDVHSRILHSRDFGSTFDILGMGSQQWRTLAIWFTPDFVYWNMDTSVAQTIRRIPRSFYQAGVGWPSITPELITGTTSAGVKYYVSRNDAPGRFPVSLGETYVEAGTTVLDAGNAVRPLDDVAFDYREDVAEIVNGAQWYQGFVTSEQGDLVSLVSVGPSVPFLRDFRARMIGIKEDTNGDPIVQEVALIEPDALNLTSSNTILTSKGQDAGGIAFYEGRRTAHARYTARLQWWDDAASAPSAPVPPPPPSEPCLPAPEPRFAAMWAACLPALGWMRRRRNRVTRVAR